MVECLTQDRGAAGLSLTGVTALCPEQDTLILAQYWLKPGRPSLHNWKYVMARKESNQTNKGHNSDHNLLHASSTVVAVKSCRLNEYQILLKDHNAVTPVRLVQHKNLEFRNKSWKLSPMVLITYMFTKLWKNTSYFLYSTILQSSKFRIFMLTDFL